jgi:hypothetical protein
MVTDGAGTPRVELAAPHSNQIPVTPSNRWGAVRMKILQNVESRGDRYMIDAIFYTKRRFRLKSK